jgi:hypothetical protein
LPSFGKGRKTFVSRKKREAAFEQGAVDGYDSVRLVASSGGAMALKGFF